MKPIKVALVHRDSRRLTDRRMVGWWSYPVPEFEWTHYSVRKRFRLDRGDFRDYDLIVYEDGKLHGQFYGSGSPIAYHIVDSTLSEEHYQVRLDQANQCDIIMVDWDDLARFKFLDKPVFRFSYCVNDKLMCDFEEVKDIDVGSFQGSTPERKELEAWLRDWCAGHGYRFEAGVYGGLDYAAMMNRCKVVINLNRNPATRGHRVFDAMACRSCLVTSPLPGVSGEQRQASIHYLEFTDRAFLAELLPHLLNDGEWEDVADSGYALVQQHHTWAARAVELRSILETIL